MTLPTPHVAEPAPAGRTWVQSFYLATFAVGMLAGMGMALLWYSP